MQTIFGAQCKLRNGATSDKYFVIMQKRPDVVDFKQMVCKARFSTS